MGDTATLRVAVAGASGRMGQMLIDAVKAAPDCVLATTLDIGSDVRAALSQARAQVLIDFTRPEGTMAHLAACRELGVSMVVGTTGFSDAQKATLAEQAQHLGIVLSPNFSVGVNVMLKLLEMAAQALDASYDIEVVEAHHRHKVDAPSGTALKMGEVLAQARGRPLHDCAVYAREGHTGERAAGTIGFATVRGGGIVGDHTAMFCGDTDRIEITHRSASRGIYAQGALRAARFVAGRRSGLYGMEHVLGFAA
jgi:4-hydroxy-tetrahydrodipicolinate reductase